MNSDSNTFAWYRRLYWLLQRELWENRSIYIAPLAAAVLFLIGFLIGSYVQAHDAELVSMPYLFAAGLLMATTGVVSVIYSLDALYGERRDRSVLFWKSLPISDLMTVLSKASIPIIVIPLVTFAIILITWIVILLLSILLHYLSGFVAEPMSKQFFQMALLTLYHLVTVHGLWYAPIYCWLLMVSAWARRAPFLWAALPLIAIVFVERIAFNTKQFVEMLSSRLNGGMEGNVFITDSMSMNPLAHVNPVSFLLSPGLWIGFSLCAVFLAVAVRLRRHHGPI